ncbi:dUTP diphosphatase [Bacillus velezensis]|uniref:dUTP diphosphatase n=1 Tax=Bacillus velezensis TaxID=492670 RepID=UPI003896CC62
MNVNIKRLSPDAQIPAYAHATDAGFDLVAAENVIIEPGWAELVPTGLAFEIPEGYEMQIRPRSGITLNTRLRVQLGTVDSGYRGEVGVIVDNINLQILKRTFFSISEIKSSVLSIASELGIILRKVRTSSEKAIVSPKPYSSRSSRRCLRKLIRLAIAISIRVSQFKV